MGLVGGDPALLASLDGLRGKVLVGGGLALLEGVDLVLEHCREALDAVVIGLL